MKLIDLHIDGFGKFHDFSVSFQDSLNIIYGKNEAGKSTIHTFIRSILFGVDPANGVPSPNDLYMHYKPWENGDIYKGSLRLEYENQIYRLERNLLKEEQSFLVYNENTRQELDDDTANEFMNQLLYGLTKVSYDNTISIGQLKSATEVGMVSELKQYISNLNSTGNIALNVSKATEYLEQQKQDFEFQIVPEAAKNYTAFISEIRNIEKEIATPEYENQLSTYQKLQLENKQVIDQKQIDKDNLLQKVTQNRQILEQNQFTDSKSITTYGQQVQQLYDDYKAIKQQSENTSRSIFSILCIVLGALLIIGAVVLFFINSSTSFGQQNFFSHQMTSLILGGLGILSIIGSVFLKWWQASLAKEVNLTAQVLQEIFSRHLGDNSISEEAMKAMVQRIEEFHHISDSLTDMEKNSRQLSDELADLEIQQDSYNETLQQQENIQRELEKKLARLANCKQQVDILKNILSENERLTIEIAAIDLALETMKNLSVSIRDSFGLHLNKTASDLISSITNGAYRSMNVDEDLNVFLHSSKKVVPMQQVSSGTLDQIYLALRLASAKLIQNGTDRLPLILDDSFVLYDEDRMKSALKWLINVYQGQIILFTCHHREMNFLKSESISFNEINI